MIDKDLSISILTRFNNKEIGLEPKAKLKEIPKIDNKTIIDCTKDISIQFTEIEMINFFNNYEIPEFIFKKCKDLSFKLSSDILDEIGIYLYPLYSFGVLNGGSATSYVDVLKNQSFDNELYNSYGTIFDKLKVKYQDKAKGITPAFINPNGDVGPSFMELKMRSLLLEAVKYASVTQKSNNNLFPIFQMTSTSNTKEISKFYSVIKNSTYLKELMNQTSIDITDVKTGIQPLITAFTHSKFGIKKSIFKDKNQRNLALPGGHGQCFLVLKSIFIDLYKNGIRFVSIGNVDNIGYTIDSKSLAILAISGKQATFDFSFKTDFDVKGGVLIKDQFNRINCADLGVAVSTDDVKKAEENGIPILFNCATGVFNLKYLLNNIDNIISKLPTRFSDQNKDSGEYSQAEQVTWEVISLLDDFLILAVDKYDRFLASKLLVENLATSGLEFKTSNIELEKCANALNKGLDKKLKTTFGLELNNGKWVNKIEV